MSGRKPTRRQFNKTLALLAAAPLAATAEAAAARPADEPPAAETFSSAAQALTEVVRLRHGKHLSAEQLKRIRQRLETTARRAAALRKTPLQNGDEPDFLFVAEAP